MNNVHTTLTAFAAAIAERDMAGAETLCSEDAWNADHGDNPQRLFRKASDERRGFSLSIGDITQGEGAGRAAATVTLMKGDKSIGCITLLGAGAPWRITGVCKDGAWRDAYLRDQVPALLTYESLPVYGPAGDAVVAVCALSRRAASGVGQADEMLAELMNEDHEGAVVIARLHFLVSQGYQVRVRDARWLPGLGRAVVKAERVKDGQSEDLWIHAEVGPPLRWRGFEELLRVGAIAAV
ncbi:MAG: hypothetical protein KC502_13740 [Myxococcales bacterium]|nr:hypothetical protein [Myxococcales bacterium]